MRNFNHFRTLCAVLASSTAALMLGGCGLGGSNLTKAATTTGAGAFGVSGNVHGGQQPVGGSVIRMYAVGSTGYGSPSVSLLNNGVTVTSATDGSGSFALTGKYTCSPQQRVYVTATGGNAGAGNNNAIALMAALGRCSDLTNSTFISLNEVTTVAAVWALAPFMSGAANVGAPVTNITGLNNAFADVSALASTARGAAGGDNLPSGTTIPVAAINTLANILASCINSSGSSSTTCNSLFTAASVSGVAPTDTLGAALNIAQHPASNVSALYSLAAGVAPFQPTLADQPSDFTLSATFAPSGMVAPSSVALDAAGNAWIVDRTTNKLTTVAHDGSPLYSVSGLSAPSSVAVDQSGSAWIANAGNNSVTKVNSTGASVGTFTSSTLNQPKSVAIDGQGNAWVANGGNNSLTVLNTAGTVISGPGYATPSAPNAVAINPR